MSVSDSALQRSERRYRALIEATNQTVWSWSTDGRSNDFEDSRRWWQEVTGQSIAEQQGSESRWLDVVHPDDREGAANAWAHALASGEPYDAQYRVQGRLGGWRWIRARGIPVADPEGHVQEWVGTLNDVTELREMASERDQLLARVESERRRLEEVFLHAPSFMAVLRGSNHVFERANDRYVELIGGRNVIGVPVREALP